MQRRFLAAFAALWLIFTLALSACSKETPEEKAERVAAEQAQKRSDKFEALIGDRQLTKDWGPQAIANSGRSMATTLVTTVALDDQTRKYIAVVGHNDRDCHTAVELVSVADNSNVVHPDSPEPTLDNWSYRVIYIAPGKPVLPKFYATTDSAPLTMELPPGAVLATQLSDVFRQRGIQRKRLELLMEHAADNASDPDHKWLAICKPK